MSSVCPNNFQIENLLAAKYWMSNLDNGHVVTVMMGIIKITYYCQNHNTVKCSNEVHIVSTKLVIKNIGICQSVQYCH